MSNSPLFRRSNPLVLVGSIAALMAVQSAHAATITYDGGVSTTGTTLDTAANWVGDVLPTTTSEVLLSNTTSFTLPSALTLSTQVTYGDLIINSNNLGSISLTGATSQSISLTGGGGSTAAIAAGGATSDLLLLGSAVTGAVTIGGGSGAGVLNYNLGTNGNFDVVNASATLNLSGVLGGNYNVAKTGLGTLTLGGANTFGSNNTFTLASGTLNINSATALGSNSNTFVINGGTIDNTSGAAITLSQNVKQTWNADYAFTGASGTTHDLYMGTGAVALGGSGTTRTITVNAGTLTEGGVISNGATANSLTKNGAGTLWLTGANTFSGGVTLNSGTLKLQGAAALGAAATATLTINGGSLAAYSSGGSGLTIGNYAQTWNGDFGFSTSPFFIAANVGVGYNDLNLNLGAGAVSLGSASGTTRTITTDGYYSNLTVGGIISNGATANSLTKNGAGILTLGGVNAFTGGITLNAGVLSLANGAALGSGTLTLNGGNLAATANTTVSTNNAQVWNGDFSFRPTYSNTYTLNMGTGPVTLGGNRVVTAVAGGLTEGGAIGDGGSNYGVTWVAGYANNIATNITLTGSSTYGGATVVQSLNGIGTVTMATGYLAATSGVTVNGVGKFIVGSTTSGTNRINPNATLTLGGAGGGTFQFLGSQNAAVNKQSFTSLTVGSGADLLITDQTTNVSQITITGATPYTRNVGGVVRINGLLGNATSNTTFTNAVTGAGNIIGSGANAMLIGATMSAGTTASDVLNFVGFTGGGTSGTLAAITSTPDSFGSGVNTSLNAGSLGIPTTGTTQSLRFDSATTLTLPGAFNVQSGGIIATYNPSAPITINGGSLQTGLAGGDLWIVQGAAASASTGMVIKSQIVDNSNSSLTKVGTRALYLTNTNNTYAGGTYLAEGILNIASEGSLGSGALNFTGAATLQAAGNVNLGSRAVNIASGVIASFDTNGNAITVGGVISGSNSGLTKNGLGTLTLTGSNSYTGITALQNGTLKLDFSASGAPVSNIINPNSLLSAGSFATLNSTPPVIGQSQTLIIQGAANTANSQTFGATNSPLGTIGSTVFTAGMNNLVFNAGSNGSLTVNLGNIARQGSAFLDVTTSGNVTVGGVDPGTMTPGGYLITSFWAGGGNNSAWATVNKSTWATVTADGNLVGIADSAYTKNTGGVIGANLMTDVVTSGTLPTGVNAVGTLRFNDTNSTGAAQTLTLSGTAVTQLTFGGILVTGNAGANDSTLSGGFLTGAYMSSLGIFQNNTHGNLVINSKINPSN